MLPLLFLALAAPEPAFDVAEDANRITLTGMAIEAAIKKKGYVSGVEAGTLHDKKTGARDLRLRARHRRLDHGARLG